MIDILSGSLGPVCFQPCCFLIYSAPISSVLLLSQITMSIVVTGCMIYPPNSSASCNSCLRTSGLSERLDNDLRMEFKGIDSE